MSRFPTLTAKKVAAALKRAGFVPVHGSGGHMTFFHPESRRTTTVSMHTGDLPRGTLKVILKQAGLTDAEFLNLL